MCEICGQRYCPAACPSAVRPPEFECAVCGDEFFETEVDEMLDDDTCICFICAQCEDADVIDEAREAHRVPLAEQFRRWARV